jgi:hypothetical protein
MCSSLAALDASPRRKCVVLVVEAVGGDPVVAQKMAELRGKAAANGKEATLASSVSRPQTSAIRYYR